jgi:hypothetical protein
MNMLNVDPVRGILASQALDLVLAPHTTTLRATWSPPDGTVWFGVTVVSVVLDWGGAGGSAVLSLHASTVSGSSPIIVHNFRVPGTLSVDRNVVQTHIPIVVRPGESLLVYTFNGTSGNMRFIINVTMTQIPIVL